MGQEIARVLRDLGPETKLVRLRGRGANFCKGRQAPQIDRSTMTPLQLRHPVAEVPLALYAAVKEARADARDRSGRSAWGGLRARGGLRPPPRGREHPIS